MLTLGKEQLSNEELLAILLKTGTKEYSSKDLAILLLKEVGSLSQLKTLTFHNLRKIKGIGNVKAATILALIELAKRMNSDFITLQNQKLNSTQIVFLYYQKKFEGIKQEQFYAVYLDNQKTVICEKLLFQGTLNYSLVHPREIFKEAVLVSASAILCIHNHPSGNCSPSKEDIKLTEKLRAIGELMGIPILDHLIIGIDQYYSFFEAKAW